MLNKAYAMGCAQAIQDATKEAWWIAPLVGAGTNIAYDQILNKGVPHSIADSALRGALIGTGASLGARLAKSPILGTAMGGTLGYLGGGALSQEAKPWLPQP